MLCEAHDIPCVVVCGRNESGQTENVYELVAYFPIEQCMREAASCLTKLLEMKLEQFPVVNNLK